MLSHIVLTLSMWLVPVECAITLIPEDSGPKGHVVNCLRQIIRKEFDFNPRDFMVLTYSFNLTHLGDQVQEECFRAIHQSRRTAVMSVSNILGDIQLTSSNKTHDDDVGATLEEDEFIQSHLFFMRTSDFYVIVVDGYRMYRSKIRQLVRVPSWNARAPIMIYLSKTLTTQKITSQYLRQMLNLLWSYKAMNVIVILHDYSNSSILNIYSWNPYDPPKRCGNKRLTYHADLVQLYDRCLGGQLENRTKLFPKKVPINMQGCPLKVLGVIFHPFLNHNGSGDNPGLDREVVNVIAERMNFTVLLNTKINIWGDRYDNGSWYGMLGALKKGVGEIGIGAIYPDNDVHEDFDATASYLQDAYVWIVPRARQLPEWESLVIILKPTMWLASGAAYLLCTFVWYVLTKIPWEDGLKLVGVVPSILDSWAMNLCASTVFRPNSDSFRMYYIFFCLYSMVWATAYQTKLITVLTHPAYEHQMNTIPELLKSKLVFGGNKAFRFLFNNSIDSTEDHLYANYKPMDIKVVMDHVIQSRNVSVLTSKQYVRYLSSVTLRFNDEHGVPLFHVMKSNVFSFGVEISATKGFSFLSQFDSLLSRMKSNGLVNLFYQRFKVRCKRDAANLAREAHIHEDETLKLNLDHLQGAFIALVMGNTLAVVVFMLELLVSKRTTKTGGDRWERVTWKGYGRRIVPGVGLAPKERLLDLLFADDRQRDVSVK